jgi:hypothetical protein
MSTNNEKASVYFHNWQAVEMKEKQANGNN